LAPGPHNWRKFSAASLVPKNENRLVVTARGFCTAIPKRTKNYPHAQACYSTTTKPSFLRKPEDWIILLKVDSSGDFMWCDAGELFSVMHESDLAKTDFSNVFVTLESS
jgi:hypothetical protein